jgi:hypothetical protein
MKYDIVLQAVVGSKLHGLNLEDHDDTDLMGVAIESPKHVIGLENFEHHITRSKPEGVRSEYGDTDSVIYSLRKWCRLALKGNPTALLLLFVPPDYLQIQTPVGERLQALAPAFMSRQIAAPFKGYFKAQKERMLGLRGQLRVTRPEYIAKYGYDTKYAMHMLRLGAQGIEALSLGKMILPIRGNDREILMRVRRGECSFDEVMNYAVDAETNLLDAEQRSTLPLEPDYGAINEFLIREYTEWWKLGSMI